MYSYKWSWLTVVELSISWHVKNKLFSDINKHNIIITRSNRPMKQFQQCVASLDSLTLLKINFKVTPKFYSKNSAPNSAQLRSDFQTPLQDSTPYFILCPRLLLLWGIITIDLSSGDVVACCCDAAYNTDLVYRYAQANIVLVHPHSW